MKIKFFDFEHKTRNLQEDVVIGFRTLVYNGFYR